MSEYRPENVKIPLPLLCQIVDLLEYWDISGYDRCVQLDYDSVYYALLDKRQRLELRGAYAKVFYAKTDDERHAARMEYLQRKHQIEDF